VKNEGKEIKCRNNFKRDVRTVKIAKKLGRSAASVQAQIHARDQAVEKFGFRVKCKRLRATHEADKTEKR